MGSKGFIFAAITALGLALGLGGCATTPSVRVTQLAPLEVATAVTHGRVSDVLVANSDSNDVVIPRYGPQVITGYPLLETSSSSVYSFDQQPIGVFPGLGYQYSYQSQVRVSIP